MTKYITTAINYLNGPPHVGHLYEAVLGDILTRQLSIQQNDYVHFQTGTDEHGQKIEDKANSLDMTPLELCNKNVKIFEDMNQQMNINYSTFIRTTDKRHYQTVRYVFNLLKDKGDIYLGKYEGWYSTREEKFITDHQAKMMDYKDEVTGKSLDRIEEETYFFRLSKYQEQIKKLYLNNSNFISSSHYQSELMERFEEGLRDLSISRTNLKWGVDLEDGHVCYVWFDALINYLSGINYFGLDYEINGIKNHWKNVIHIIGKDILWFHGVIWIGMLMALEIELPKQIIVHGFITDKDGHKMSKSIGNVIDPYELIKCFPVDVIRFYLVRYNNIGGDLKCSFNNIVKFNNSELADNIGNLVNRIVNLLHKFCNSRIPDVDIPEGDEMLQLLDTNFVDKQNNYYHNSQTREASQLILDLFHQLNLWLTQKQPWKIKDNDELRNKIMRVAVERLNQISILLYPIMPTVYNNIRMLVPLNSSYHTLKDCHCKLSMDLIKLEKKKLILFPKLDFKE